MTGTIVVAADGTSGAREAQRRAAALAADGDGVVHLVGSCHGVEDWWLRRQRVTAPLDIGYSLEPRAQVELELDDAAELVESLRVAVRRHVRSEPTAQALRTVAAEQDADAIVVNGRLARWAVRAGGSCTVEDVSARERAPRAHRPRRHGLLRPAAV